MTTIEPWADLGQTKKQFMAYLLGPTEKRIAEEERMFPCTACLACQWTTCVKAGAYQYRRLLLEQLETAR
jgi:hypothetical protein